MTPNTTTSPRFHRQQTGFFDITNRLLLCFNTNKPPNLPQSNSPPKGGGRRRRGNAARRGRTRKALPTLLSSIENSQRIGVLIMRFAAAVCLLFLSIATAVRCQFGTKSAPAVSCKALLSGGGKPGSGVYWIKPKGHTDAFQGYCDMETFGGGWLMCYTTNLHVHVSREVSGTVPYGSNGYRSDCRNFPFNHVMSVIFICSSTFSKMCAMPPAADLIVAATGTWTTQRKSASTIATPLSGFNSTALAPSRPAPQVSAAV